MRHVPWSHSFEGKVKIHHILPLTQGEKTNIQNCTKAVWMLFYPPCAKNSLGIRLMYSHALWSHSLEGKVNIFFHLLKGKRQTYKTILKLFGCSYVIYPLCPSLSLSQRTSMNCGFMYNPVLGLPPPPSHPPPQILVT